MRRSGPQGPEATVSKVQPSVALRRAISRTVASAWETKRVGFDARASCDSGRSLRRRTSRKRSRSRGRRTECWRAAVAPRPESAGRHATGGADFADSAHAFPTTHVPSSQLAASRGSEPKLSRHRGVWRISNRQRPPRRNRHNSNGLVARNSVDTPPSLTVGTPATCVPTARSPVLSLLPPHASRSAECL